MTAGVPSPPQAPAPAQPEWGLAVLEAGGPDAVCAAVVARARALAGVRQARLLWELAPASVTGAGVDPATLALADAAVAAALPRLDAAHHRLALPLPASTAVLLLELEPDADAGQLASTLAAPLHAADLRLRDQLRLLELEAQVCRLERSEQVQRALFGISGLAGSGQDMGQVLQGIHRIVDGLMYAENFFIALRDATTGAVHFPYFADVHDPPPDGELPPQALEHTLTGYVLRDGQVRRRVDGQMRTPVDGPVQLLGTDAVDWLGVPMRRDGITHGALVVQSYRPGHGYSTSDQSVLEFVATHVLTTLERHRSTLLLEHRVAERTRELAVTNRGLQQQILERQRAERLQAALFEIAQLATADLDEDQFHRRVHEIVGSLLNARNFFIALLSQDRRWMEFPYYIDTHRRRTRSRRPVGQGLTEHVLRHRAPLLAYRPRLAELEQAGEVRPGTVGTPAHCWLGVPLFFGDDAIGVVAVQSYDERVGYDAGDQELLGFVASQVATSMQRRRSLQIQQRAYALLEERVAERTEELRREIRERMRIQKALEREVLHDALTGLPNRRHLHERVSQALAALRADPRRRCALLYLDVDRFKVVNDSLGHLAGDTFLREVAQRLQGCVRAPDMVARVSGDEFAILLDDIVLEADGQPASATAVAQRVIDALGTPMQVAGRTLSPSASIGIAVGDGGYLHAHELVRDADTALYRAKGLGRQRWQLFDQSLRRSAVDELELEAELRQGLQHDQFEPWLQPIVRLADGAVVGHEALLRWRHPRRGVLAPAAFQRVAEDSGLSEAIDWRMYKRSFSAAAAHDDGSFISINVAPRHLRRDDFDARLTGLLQRTGLAPQRLLVEVTEGALVDDPETARVVLERLRAAGVGTALDDFGTGYASLSYLQRFPLRMLKIDRGFVAGLPGGARPDAQTAALVGAVLGLARALGIDAIAEGVATPAQREALRALGCEYGQGELFGMAAPRGG